jgi:hypothetical protein
MNISEIRPTNSSKFTVSRDSLIESARVYAVALALQSGTGHYPVVVNGGTTVDGFEFTAQPVRTVTIKQSDLPKDEPYEIKREIPARIVRGGLGEYTAEIAEANLAATGQTQVEAFTNLVFELLDAFDYLSANQSRLGPEPIRQWNYLRDYIGKTNNGPR